MVEDTLVVTNEAGLHARPAALFVRTAALYKATIKVSNLTKNPNKEADAKSILGVMGLAVRKGDTIRIRAEGDDAEAAVEALRQLNASGYQE